MEKYDWKPEEPMLSAAQTVDSVTKKAKRTFGDHLNAVSLLVLVLLQIFVPFVTAGFRNPFTPDYFFTTACNLASTLMGYYLFIPNGKRDRKKQPDIENAYTEWQRVCDAVKARLLLGEFRIFCREYAKEEAKRIRERRIDLLENAGIPKEDFENTYLNCPNVKQYKKKLTKEQYKLILLCRKPVDIRPVSPNFVLAGTEEKGIDSIHADSTYEKRAMIMKPFVCIAFILITSFLAPEHKENEDVFVTIVNIVTRIFCVLWASLSGYRTGVKSAECHCIDMKNKTAFIEEFMEQHKGAD